MAFTAKLGTSDSRTGNIVLGFGSAQPSPWFPVPIKRGRPEPDWSLEREVRVRQVITGALFHGTGAAGTYRKLLLPRDPNQPLRTKRFLQIVSQIMNSMIHGGTFNQVDDDQWGMANLFFTGDGEPAESLAYDGDYYLDLQTGILYKKV